MNSPMILVAASILLFFPNKVMGGCSLCPGDAAMAFPNQLIPGTTLTCLELQDDLRNEISNDEECKSFPVVPNSNMNLASFCGCQCTICPDGSSVLHPTRELNMGTYKANCQTLVNMMKHFTPVDCELFYESTPVDLVSFCGCQDQLVSPSVTKTKKCVLCGDLYVRNINQVIPDSGGLTCGKANELADYVVDDGFCQNRIEILRGDCCSLDPPGPTASPTGLIVNTTIEFPDYVAIPGDDAVGHQLYSTNVAFGILLLVLIVW